jgi:hypothetical protein
MIGPLFRGGGGFGASAAGGADVGGLTGELAGFGVGGGRGAVARADAAGLRELPALGAGGAVVATGTAGVEASAEGLSVAPVGTSRGGAGVADGAAGKAVSLEVGVADAATASRPER